MNPADISGLILCGGRGARMGTVDKGLLEFDGLAMVDHVIARLRPQVSGMSINANQNISTYLLRGLPVVEDEIGGFVGPLAGMHAGMQQCTTPWLAVVPCDSPFLPLDLVARLAHSLGSTHADIAVPITGAGSVRQQHSAFCLVRKGLANDLSTYLAGGGRKVQTWYDSLKMVEVPFDDEAGFRNFNTPAELAAYERNTHEKSHQSFD